MILESCLGEMSNKSSETNKSESNNFNEEAEEEEERNNSGFDSSRRPEFVVTEA